MKTSKLWAALALSTGLILSGNTAATPAVEQPTPLIFSPCQSTILSLVQHAADCTFATNVSQDFLETDPMTVNITPGFFGQTDWLFSKRWNFDDSQGQTGNYDFSDSIAAVQGEDVMLVFKSANKLSLVGYLLEDGFTSGDWQSMFREPAFDMNPDGKIMNVSHLTVYYRGGQVPEPGSLALFGLGLAALGFIARRRRVA